MKVFDAVKARKVLERVNKFLGILIRENLVKDAPFLDEGELENESDLADDVWEVLQGIPRNCDIGTLREQNERFDNFCSEHSVDSDYRCEECPLCDECCCTITWEQMPYEAATAEDKQS